MEVMAMVAILQQQAIVSVWKKAEHITSGGEQNSTQLCNAY